MELTSTTFPASGSADLPRLSVGMLLIVGCSISNSAIADEEHDMPSHKVKLNQHLEADIGHHFTEDAAVYEQTADNVSVSAEEANEAFSEFVAKLTTDMVSAPANVHREIAQHPWDFI